MARMLPEFRCLPISIYYLKKEKPILQDIRKITSSKFPIFLPININFELTILRKKEMVIIYNQNIGKIKELTNHCQLVDGFLKPL